MTWVSGYVRFNKPSENQRLFNGDILLTRINDMVIHGVVTEAEGKTPVPGTLVKVFARSAGGREVPVGHSYSTDDGHYLVSFNKNSIPPGATAILIRAVTDNLSPD